MRTGSFLGCNRFRVAVTGLVEAGVVHHYPAEPGAFTVQPFNVAAV
jgi:hypothetical protein